MPLPVINSHNLHHPPVPRPLCQRYFFHGDFLGLECLLRNPVCMSPRSAPFNQSGTPQPASLGSITVVSVGSHATVDVMDTLRPSAWFLDCCTCHKQSIAIDQRQALVCVHSFRSPLACLDWRSDADNPFQYFLLRCVHRHSIDFRPLLDGLLLARLEIHASLSEPSSVQDPHVQPNSSGHPHDCCRPWIVGVCPSSLAPAASKAIRATTGCHLPAGMTTPISCASRLYC